MSEISLLNSIQANLFRYGGLFLILNATISFILNLLVFTKSTLRKNPCAICFIAVTVSNLLFIYLSFISRVMAVGFNTDPTITNIVYCRLQSYATYVFSCLGPFYMILASIDRILVTSRDADIRKRSTCRLAITCIIIITLFWMIFNVHAFIFIEIIQVGLTTFICYLQPGNYSTFIAYHSLLMNAIILPSLMIVFGLWTVKNVNKIRNNIHHADSLINTSTTMRRTQKVGSKDHQLIKMLLVDTTVFIIFRFPFAMFLVYQQITQYQVKSSDQMEIDFFGLNVTTFLFLIVPAISCYTNLFVSKTFRAELKQTFLRCQVFRFIRPN